MKTCQASPKLCIVYPGEVFFVPILCWTIQPQIGFHPAGVNCSHLMVYNVLPFSQLLEVSTWWQLIAIDAQIVRRQSFILLVLASKQALDSFYPQHSSSRVRLFAWLQATTTVHHKLAWACDLSLPQNWHVRESAWSVATKIFIGETC